MNLKDLFVYFHRKKCCSDETQTHDLLLSRQLLYQLHVHIRTCCCSTNYIVIIVSMCNV